MATIWSHIFLWASLLLLFLPLNTAQEPYYYVKPTSDTSCPANPCLTLSEYVQQRNQYLTSNATMMFLPGIHKLDNDFVVTNVTSFRLLGDPTSLPEVTTHVTCTSPVGFSFDRVLQLEISGLSITGCGSPKDDYYYYYYSYSCAICATSVQQFYLNNCSLYNSVDASALYVEDSIVSITHTVFNNSAVDNDKGGGVLALNSKVAFEHCSFVDNSGGYSGDGGAVYSEGSNVTIEYCSFVDNSAESDGGAVYSEGSGKVTIEHCSFVDNSAESDGGAVYSEGSGKVTIEHCSFVDNSAEYFGGAVYSEGSGKVTIEYCSFVDNSAEYDGGAVDSEGSGKVTIEHCSFVDNSAEYFGGAVYNEGSGKVTIEYCSFVDNSAEYFGGAVFSFSYSGGSGEVTIEYCSFMNNSAGYEGGAIHVSAINMSIGGNNTFSKNMAQDSGGGISVFGGNVSFTGINNFIGNSAADGGAILLSTLFNQNLDAFQIVESTLILNGRITIQDNTASFGGGISITRGYLAQAGDLTFLNNQASNIGGAIDALSCSVFFHGNVVFRNNSAKVIGGAFSIRNSQVNFTGSTAFANNSAYNQSGGAVYALASEITLAGNVSFFHNHAAEGGGMLLTYNSKLYFQSGGLANFEGNTADRGAAIHVIDSVSSFDCEDTSALSIGLQDVLKPNCFFDLPQMSQPVFFFINNIAEELGSALYGGFLSTCKVDSYINSNTFNSTFNPTSNFTFIPAINVFQNISNFASSNTVPLVSSKPFQVCFCQNSMPTFTNKVLSVEQFRGQTFTVSLVALDQVMNPIPATIRAEFLSSSETNARLGDFEGLKAIDGNCTELQYTIFSRNNSETLILFAEGPCRSTGTAARSIDIKFCPCPDGFVLSNGECTCEERLQKVIDKSACKLINGSIERSGTFWMGVHYEHSMYKGLILHPHCPFDYCTNEPVNVTLTKTDDMDQALDDIDAQCVHGRSGILCGSCHSGLSIALGSSHCLHCSNAYLALILPFAVLGVLLVITILLLKLTVAIGTISGLIFYADIISANRNIFFPPGDTNVLTVFIAWLNLDWGIETCFYDGMDTYAKTWLQFVFPFYIWALVGLIIIASHFSMKISKVLGSNPVAVLATLFLLSYAKILSTVVTALSFASLEYPDNITTPVWLYDGNIEYFDPKHIPLFLFSLLILLFLFLPYTLLLFFHQWLQMKSEYRILKWVTKPQVKAFMDAYHAPYTPNHRYWTGLLLILRCALYLVFAFNTMRDPSVNLLVIATSTFGITIIVWLTGRVYENWWLDALESSFILNLGVLAVGTYHIKLTGGNQASQAALVYTLVSIAFTTFIGIISYHAYFQLKSTQTGRRPLESSVLFFQGIWTKITQSNSTDKQSRENEGIANDSSITSSYVELRELLLDDK